MILPPTRKKIVISSIILILAAPLAVAGYFLFFKERFSKGYTVETEGIHATVKTEETEYYSLFGTVKDKKDEENVILIENEGEEEWVKINPDNILRNDREDDDIADDGGSRIVVYETIPFSEVNVGDKVTIYNLVEREGSTLNGEKVVVWGS